MSCKSICIWPILSGFGANIHKEAKAFAVFNRGESAILITKKDEIYALGINGEQATLGIGKTNSVVTPVILEGLNRKKIKSLLSAGSDDDARIVALTLDRKILTWGSNRGNGLGYDSSGHGSVPRPVAPHLTFIKVAIGHSHTLAITFEHKVYGWGDNQYGQLGTGNFESSVTPVLSGALNDNETLDIVNDVACGGKNSYYLTKNKVYSVGCGKSGALGVVNHDESQNMFDQLFDLIHGEMQDTAYAIEVTVANEKIDKIFAGESTAYAVTIENETFGWGRNDYYQLGGFDGIDQVVPIRIGSYHEIATHCDSHLVGGIDGTVYVWGKSRFGVLQERVPTTLKQIDDIFVVYDKSHTHRLVDVPSDVVIISPINNAPDGDFVTIHPGSCNDEGFLVSWGNLENNSLFFKVLLQKGLISEEIKDYVIVGFDDTTVRIYVEYLSKLTIAPNDKKYLKDVINLALFYREWNLLLYIIDAFGVYPGAHDEQLTIEDVCLVYEAALEANEESVQSYCIQFISLNMMAVFLSDTYLNGIKPTTMQSIMRALATLHGNTYQQIAIGRGGHEGEGVIHAYPDVLTKPLTQDLFEMIYKMNRNKLKEQLTVMKNHVEEVLVSKMEKPVIHKCITLPQPAMYLSCF